MAPSRITGGVYWSEYSDQSNSFLFVWVILSGQSPRRDARGTSFFRIGRNYERPFQRSRYILAGLEFQVRAVPLSFVILSNSVLQFSSVAVRAFSLTGVGLDHLHIGLLTKCYNDDLSGHG